METSVPQQDSAYGTNLRYCCDHYRSISAVCRQLEFNRQQFNKYINGQSQPSRHNHRRISDFFGLDYHELFMPHEDFVKLLTAKRRIAPGIEIGGRIAKHVTTLLAANSHETKAYTGFFYKYFHSMTEPTRIKRDLCHFYMRHGILCTSTKERVTSSPDQETTRGFLSYRGTVALLGGRLFWIECDRELQSEVTLSILFPSPIKTITRLEGLVLGTGLDRARRIVSSRVVLQYLGRDIDKRSHLSRVGVYDEDDPTLDGDILKLLNTEIPAEDRVLQMQSWQ